VNSSIRSAIVVDPWILLVLESGRVVVYEMNGDSKDVDIHSKLAKIDVCLDFLFGSHPRGNSRAGVSLKDANGTFCLRRWDFPGTLRNRLSEGGMLTTMEIYTPPKMQLTKVPKGEANQSRRA